MISPPPLLETERLCLRTPVIHDAPALLKEYAGDPDVTRYLSWRPHKEVATVEAFLRQVLDAKNNWHWAIALKGTDLPIGMIHAELHGHRMNFGYVLGKRFWGKGYMPEALRCLVDWALGQEHIHRAWSFCDVDNRPSARVMEKAGMQREGVLRKWFIHPNVSDVARDCYVYSCIRGYEHDRQWPKADELTETTGR